MKEIKIQISEVERDLKELDRKEIVTKDKLLMTEDFSITDLFKMLETDASQISASRTQLVARLEELRAIQNKFLEPISTDALKKAIKIFLGQMVKSPNATHRGMLENIIHKIVVKEGQEIEVNMFGDFILHI